MDGADEAGWKEESTAEMKRGADAVESRYRDWENLQYWFRGVEKFAPG
ncbi:MAG: hypothetical protein V8Q57_00815 [Blautia sp.]